MPKDVTANINISTPYGPAAYTFTLTDQGEVTGVESAAARLPETVFKLTYGERWEAARAHFQDLAALLPFQAEAAALLTAPPAEFKVIRRAFRDLTFNETDAFYRQRAIFWRDNPSVTPALFRQKKMPRALVTLYRTLRSAEKPERYRALEPWVFAMLPLVVEVAERENLYHILALTRTDSSREFLYGELERPGRHIYATSLLRSLSHFRDKKDLTSLLELYPSLGDESGLMTEYMALIASFKSPLVHQRLEAILDSFPQLAPEVLRFMKKADHPAPYATIRARFDQETDSRLVDQLAELTDATAEHRVTLAQMNAKMAAPTFTDGPPVTWPQSLGTYWNRLVKSAATEEVLEEVSKYLLRPNPRLQRNALLQLKVWAKAQQLPPALPPVIEDSLRELITARFDKIFTVALDVVAICMPSLSRPEAMVDVLLEHSLVSRYRLMDAAALKKAAERPGLKERQITFFRRAINNSTEITELESIRRFIPYVNFLDVRPELEKLVRERMHTI